MIPHGPWQIVRSGEVYRDPWIDVRRDEVIRPDGAAGTHCVVSMKAGVSVVPLDDAGYVYLTDEFHYAIGRCGIEAVSGGREANEPPLEAARRELAEELGIAAEEWIDLGCVDPFTTIIVSPTQLYLARRLAFNAPSPEGTECIRVVRVAFDEAVRWAIDGRISHAPSCVLLLRARLMLGAAGRF